MGLNVQKFCDTLAMILSNKYDCDIKITATPKEKKENG